MTTNTQPTLEITFDDLKAVRQLIDVVSQRGAFMGNELTTVGTLRDKIHAFIEAATEAEKAATEEETEEE